MLAKRSANLPSGDGWMFEPKWDGFRALVFIEDGRVELQSRDTKPLARYFPELLGPLAAQLPNCVLDGEIVIMNGEELDFPLLQNRLHPAESRVLKLAAETPASLVVWDLLAVGEQDLRGLPFSERRIRLETLLAGARPPLHLTPLTRDRDVAADWFERFEGAGLDGVMAKAETGTYEPGKRVMLKVKHKRTVDCVVGGFRWHKNGPGTLLGSLMLGLYTDLGALNHVGVAASFTAQRREELIEELAPYRVDALDGHPWEAWATAKTSPRGGGSRWSAGKNLGWEPLRAELVVEVTYDHMQGSRFRHTAHFARWRPDKPAAECTYEQLDTTPPFELQAVFKSSTEN